MLVDYLCLGAVQTNCYFLQNEETKQLLIVDPGDNAPAIFKKVQELEGKAEAILLTHGHFDHILACKEVAEHYSIPVYAYEQEEALLADPRQNLSEMAGCKAAIKPDVLLKDGEKVEKAGFLFQVLHTPGHTKGSCCYFFPEEKILMSGDTLFRCSCGRTDFPGGSYESMQKSLKMLISSLPEETKVYPGHDGSSTIGDEKRLNPFV